MERVCIAVRVRRLGACQSGSVMALVKYVGVSVIRGGTRRTWKFSLRGGERWRILDSKGLQTGRNQGLAAAPGPQLALVRELPPDGSVHGVRDGVDHRPCALGAVAQYGHRGACLRNVRGPE
jgi:hypothetical protein